MCYNTIYAVCSNKNDNDDVDNNDHGSQDEEGRSSLGVVQEAEVGGDGLGHHLEVRLEAAKDARERAVHARTGIRIHPLEPSTKSEAPRTGRAQYTASGGGGAEEHAGSISAT